MYVLYYLFCLYVWLRIGDSVVWGSGTIIGIYYLCPGVFSVIMYYWLIRVLGSGVICVRFN